MHFMYFLMYMVAANIAFVMLASSWLSVEYGQTVEGNRDHFIGRAFIYVTRAPFVIWCMGNSCLHIVWVSFLFMFQLKNIMFHDMTTNEFVNRHRYSYLRGGVNDETSPWHKGPIKNLVSSAGLTHHFWIHTLPNSSSWTWPILTLPPHLFLKIEFFSPTVDWTMVYSVPNDFSEV